MRRTLTVRHLGRVEYEDGLALMAKLSKAVEEGRAGDTLLLLEHPPVLTLGRGADGSNILAPKPLLEREGVEVFPTDRGGDVTYHGPGQLVGYPIFDLKPDRQDVRKYVRGVEEALIRVLARYGLVAGRIPKWTGVWVGEESDPKAVKAAAIGIHIRKWITTHGFALNVNTNLNHFRLINPCGITERGVGSIASLLGHPVDFEETARFAAAEFASVFEAEPVEAGFDRETVSVAVVRPSARGPEALVLTRTADRGRFSQIVTGKIEPGETPAAAAARELHEETGLSLPVDDLRYVHAFGFGDEPRFFREHAFAAVAAPGAVVRHDPAEHSGSAWLPLAEAVAAMPFKGLKRALEAAAKKLSA
jgi:lipoyl(octanoyl) transferase